MSLFSKQDLSLSGVSLITPKFFSDERGFSMTTYHAEEFAALGSTTFFVQEYISFSKKNVIRGLHYQKAPYIQDKLIRCAQGRVLDVIADFDPTSLTFGKHVALELDAAKGEVLFVPGIYAHGFCVLSDEGALVEYKMNSLYNPESVGGIRYDDPSFSIVWPIKHPVLSAQDTSWPLLSI